MFYIVVQMGHPHFGMAPAALLDCFAVTRLEPGWKSRTLTFLGSISYAMYLMHPIVHHCVNKVLGKIQSLTGKQSFGDQFLNFLNLACSVAATLVISAVIYRFIEKPVIALGKRLGKRRSQLVAGQSAKAVANLCAGE